MTRRIWELLLSLLGVVLALWVASAMPNATITRYIGVAVVSVIAALAAVVLWERLELQFQLPVRRSGSRSDRNRSSASTSGHMVDPPLSAPSTSAGPEKLRADLAENLLAVKEFYAEVEKITGPGPTAEDSQDDAIALDLLRLASDRLADIPLRRNEMLAIVHVLREAIVDVEASPFTDGDVTQDITTTDEVRDDRIWKLSLKTAQAYGGGVLLSDGTYKTLDDLHRKLLDLRREVYRKYHPPVLPH